MTIGDKIRNMRTIKGYSQENMAELLGVSVTAYAKIERGETDVNHSRLEQIAAVLKVSLPELVAFGEGQFIYIGTAKASGNAITFSNGVVNNYGQVNPELLERLIAIEERLYKLENGGL